jgi:SH3-like domain-containing protein
MNRFAVVRTYAATYADPISFEAGDRVEVQRPDAEFPGWHWCRNRSGKEGWVHRSFLEGEAGMTVGIRAYSARELSVDVGAAGTVLQQLDGWLYVELQDGRQGWLPVSHVASAT